jgi:folate-binding protein YgfZ
MIRLPYLSTVLFSGPDALDFLHAQLSSDIRALQEGDATFACYCTPRGQVLGLLLVGRSNQGYRVTAAAELLPGIVQRLKMFVLRSKVEVDFPLDLEVSGLPPQGEYPETFEVFTTETVPLHYAIGPTGSTTEQNCDSWRLRELGFGISWLNAHTAEKFIPQMLGFDNIGAVNFRKGCYPGQEIVARARHLGKVKRKPLIATAVGLGGLTDSSSILINYATESIKGILVDLVPTQKQSTKIFMVAREVVNEFPDSVTIEEQTYPLLP